MSKGKVVLAYSGGLDTSIILKWMLEEGYDVIAYIADVGQEEDFEAAREKAIKIGASKVYVEDLKSEFVTDYIFPTFKANAVYEGRYLLGTSVARPIIAKKQIEIAIKEKAEFVGHGATGKGNDQVRFELSYYALKPDIKVLAPWKMPEFLSRFRGRTDMIQYAEQHGIPIKASRAKPYSEDDNLLHISHEAGILEDPNAVCGEEVYSRTATIETAPNVADIISITFKDGNPVKVSSDGKTETDPLKLFSYLNELGTKHGIGRLDMVENRFVGIKSRGVYETPGGAILLAAHRDIEGLVMDREVMRIRDTLSLKVAELIYNGFWFSPEFEFLMKCIDESQKGIDGVVKMKLLKGVPYAIARESDKALYDPKLSSMDEEGGYDQQDAAGFIRINAVRLRNWARVAKK
ncbi:MAG: argininosuccinate synthase [Micavibrio aeruginosavorus]|uniref:Argininosuccinate synthase n=1 Tax=Micavibrio aeruginosavorus TaxID=349221 RepID=A0A2W5FLT8_9BACT|nr:MAG: argininosuccinate synthase [Micavibrio aeruginosavorus]